MKKAGLCKLLWGNIQSLELVIESWSVLDVSNFLMTNSFDEEVVKVFCCNQISSKVLSLLTEEDFKELGLT